MKTNFLTFLMSVLGQDPSKKVVLPRAERIAIKKAKRERRGSSGTKNKGKGESDIRKKMAKESNRINRDRIKKWKY